MVVHFQLPYVPRAPVLLQAVQRLLQRMDLFSPTLLAHLEEDVLTLFPRSLQQYLAMLDVNGMIVYHIMYLKTDFIAHLFV